jgi:hypothetical protein
MQAPMISAPLKATNEIDWIQPLKQYIRQTYGDDPERYAEECATLNRLRQDMRGAGKDSAAGRDLLYRYYGQLELLDLRFPVDENHIKISFTWYDVSYRREGTTCLLTLILQGSMRSHTNPRLNILWLTKRLQSSLTYPLFYHAMQHTKHAPKTPVSRRPTILSKPQPACSHISMRIFSMLLPQT